MKTIHIKSMVCILSSDLKFLTKNARKRSKMQSKRKHNKENNKQQITENVDNRKVVDNINK